MNLITQVSLLVRQLPDVIARDRIALAMQVVTALDKQPSALCRANGTGKQIQFIHAGAVQFNLSIARPRLQCPVCNSLQATGRERTKPWLHEVLDVWGPLSSGDLFCCRKPARPGPHTRFGRNPQSVAANR